LQSTLGYRPVVSFDTGLERTVAAFAAGGVPGAGYIS
jgi:hypothetical protein